MAQRLVDTAAAAMAGFSKWDTWSVSIPPWPRSRSCDTTPLFFEVHRLSLFSARSLDVDVVLDLMIHDLDIVLWLAGAMPEEVRAAGIRILSEKVDIANVRLAFPTGCIANLTASRVSTERVRKLRLFQPHQYISLDYEKQQGAVFTPGSGLPDRLRQPGVEKVRTVAPRGGRFPGRVAQRRRPRVSGEDGLRALTRHLDILAKIEEHTKLSLAATSPHP